MKDDVLREMIRTEIKKNLKEADFLGRARSTVTSRIDRVTNLAGVKLLKKALGQGSTEQKAAGILSVVQVLADNDPKVIEKIKQRLQMKSVRQSVSQAPGEEV